MSSSLASHGSSPSDVLTLQAGLIKRLARATARRGGLPSSDIDDFESVCWLHLVEKDFHVLRQYRGEAILPAYLQRVFHRVLLDYRTAKWGKWRPSAAARRAGPRHVAFERLSVRDGIPPEEALVRAGLSKAALTDEIRTAPLTRRPQFVDLKEASARACPHGGADQLAIRRAQQQRSIEIVAALRTALGELSEKDRELVWLRYHDGLSVAAIASATGSPQKPLYRWFDRIHALLRHVLESAGVTPSDVLDIEGDPLVCLDFRAPTSTPSAQLQ